MADPARAARLAQRIKVLIAEAMRKAVKDDRVEPVTITEVRVTNDLQHASVYYTVLGDDTVVEEAREGMEANRGILRREVGRGLTIRLVPTLEFIPDTVPEAAAHLEDVLRAARERDAEIAAASTGARYAGDEDPYRKDDEESESAEDTREH
ncbi:MULTISPECIES: 30S ribosome-binding factor RbfA [Citricoccus]|uniref:Ribosome-binding factor A n=1 Tax=Citricoccus muralis TaxID=169134 RepID=A0ABY8HAD2_9MICC|nr:MULTISPECIES: 30S ribosome-binding factor RbfA [Citricoccus]WBL18721.1 30S ribosome-binding factor RbfA [Citricoccus sp. NR2]WFP17598.1 30S ribosome-binding factor RbfA [Citricoccus muralis]